jgi:hypothetical protein
MADFIVKASTGKNRDGKEFTTIVGRGFKNKAGGINVRLNVLPIPQDGQVSLTLWPDDGERRNKNDSEGDSEPPF